jgi:hypothetical protein
MYAQRRAYMLSFGHFVRLRMDAAIGEQAKNVRPFYKGTDTKQVRRFSSF